MCKSITETFGWLGAILVNFGFISLIAWGSAQQWVVGFGLCAMYTMALFIAARYFEDSPQREPVDASLATSSSSTDGYETLAPVSHVDRERSEQSDLNQSCRRIPIISNILYALSIAGLGASLFFLPVNLFNCEPDTVPPPNRAKWITDISTLPAGVRHWADENSPSSDRVATFAYLPATGTTIFGARREIPSPGVYPPYVVWEARGSSAPKQKEYYQSPTSFITVSSDTACFKARDNSLICLKGNDYLTIIQAQSTLSPYDLFVEGQDNDLLWFKARDPIANGYRVQSFNTTDQQQVNYSTLKRPEDDNRNEKKHDHRRSCTYDSAARRLSLESFFLVAVPVTVASLLLWYLRGIPSMGLTFLVGIELLYITIEGVIRKQDYFDWDRRFGDWNLVVGLMMLVVLTALYLVKEVKSVNWGLNGAGIMFMAGMTTSFLNNVSFGGDTLGDWVIVNLFCFPILVFFGVANKTIFLVFLGGLGIMLDAWRLASLSSDKLIEGNAVLIGFLIFAVAGLFEVALGLFLNRNQDAIQQNTASCAKEVWTKLQNCGLLIFRDSVNGPTLLETETAPLRDAEQTVVDRAYVAETTENIDEERL